MAISFTFATRVLALNEPQEDSKSHNQYTIAVSDLPPRTPRTHCQLGETQRSPYLSGRHKLCERMPDRRTASPWMACSVSPGGWSEILWTASRRSSS